MSAKSMRRFFLPLCVALGSMACSQQAGNTGAPASEVRQTKFPGQETAGGQTSGQLMSQAGTLKDKEDSEGTPGIPQGAGGNTGGAATGDQAKEASTTEGEQGETAGKPAEGRPGADEQAGEAGRQQAPVPEPAPADNAKSEAEAKAAREKRELEDSMSAVAQHWRMRAADNHWSNRSATAAPDATEGAAQEDTAEQPLIRSEKLGTAPASEDVKKAPSPGSEAGTPAL